METPAYFTLGQAHNVTGVAKGTLSKALKSGKLSYVEKTKAGYKIDPAELFRVFPKKPHETVSNERLETLEETLQNKVLQAKLDAQERLMERVLAENDDLKSQRDKWEQQATAQTRLLETNTRSWWPWSK